MEDSQQSSGTRLVVGLGNPGMEYAETRHNAGFQVCEEVLRKVSSGRSVWQPGNGVLDVLERPGKASFMVLRPLTFMNLSGTCVVRVTEHFGISPSEVLVISDDVDLPYGRLRLRAGGGCGGQKGLGSIIAELGTEAVPRLRVGIGRPQSADGDMCEHVLSSWTSVERAVLPDVLGKCCETILRVVDRGLASGMEGCNGWSTDNNNADN